MSQNLLTHIIKYTHLQTR